MNTLPTPRRSKRFTKFRRKHSNNRSTNRRCELNYDYISVWQGKCVRPEPEPSGTRRNDIDRTSAMQRKRQYNILSNIILANKRIAIARFLQENYGT